MNYVHAWTVRRKCHYWHGHMSYNFPLAIPVKSLAETVGGGYWTEEMEGVVVDQLIFEHLLQEHQPQGSICNDSQFYLRYRSLVE